MIQLPDDVSLLKRFIHIFAPTEEQPEINSDVQMQQRDKEAWASHTRFNDSAPDARSFF